MITIEIYVVDGSGEPPLATTYSTQVTLSDADYNGVKQLQVRARDRHKNIGSVSDPTIAVFPTALIYEINNEE